EERRVFHVAITRASQSVTLATGPSPSPFVAELSTPRDPDALAPAPRPGPSRAKPPASGSAPRPSPQTPEGIAVREALRVWRAQKASSEGKPAFVYFSDATLDEMATAMPSSLAELARVKGIGPAKLEAYGEVLLAIIDEHRPA
ncbi:MAG: HRDC domain-containing protein, partial [Acidimicrobiales bacterium]